MQYDFIAIEGNIGAGKSTLARQLSEKVGAKLILEEFNENPFLPKFYENPERYAFPVELSFLAERFSQLKEELGTRDLFHQLVVADYFISKCLIFSKANLQPDEFDLFSKMYSIIEQNLPKPDLLVYLYLSTENLQRNIKKRGRSYEQNIENSYLEKVQASYFQFIKQHRDLRVLVLDTNNLDFAGNKDDFESVCQVIDHPYPKGVTRLTL